MQSKPRDLQRWRCEVEVMPADGECEMQDLFDALKCSPIPNAKWIGFRREEIFYGLCKLVAICFIDNTHDESNPADTSAVEIMLEQVRGMFKVQSVRLLSQTSSQGHDPFTVCQGIFHDDARVRETNFQSGITLAHVRHLIDHGYTVIDQFTTQETVEHIASLTRTSLETRESRNNDEKDKAGEDGISWITPEPRNARKDVTTWLHEGHPIVSLVAAQFDALQQDLCCITRLRSQRELQLACYPGDGGGYKRHTDAIPETDMDGVQRKVTAILYCNPQWEIRHGGLLQMRLADHDGGGVVDIEPKGGRLLMFLSGCMMHEVLPSHATRLAITSWFW